MKYLIVATASSALPDYKLKADDPAQPYLAAVSLIYCPHGLVAETTKSFLVKPEGWTLSQEVMDHTGYTMSELETSGVDVREPLQLYGEAIDDGYTIVAYNAAHHCKVLRGAMRRVGMDDRFTRTETIDVMRAAMGHVIKEGGKKGFPKLTDCVRQFEIEVDPRKAHGVAIATLITARELVRTCGVELRASKPEAGSD